MKYSISILFLLTILAAIESALFRRRLEWPVLVSIGVGLLLLWTQFQEKLVRSTASKEAKDRPEGDKSLTSAAPTKTVSNKLYFCATAFCFGAALFSILTAPTDPETGKLLGENPRIVSAQSVLILATMLMASSLVHIPSRLFKPLHIAAYALIAFALIFAITTLAENGFMSFLVYIACRSIENATPDPAHVLGPTNVLLFNAAALKAVAGFLGCCTWIVAAIFAYRRVQRRPSGVFVEVWIACGLGCLATFFQWRFLLADFPELRLALSELHQQKYTYNLIMFLVLGVTGFLQYCMIDRSSDQPSECFDQVRRNRLLGLAMMLPALLKLFIEAVVLYNKLPIGTFGWMFLAEKLLDNDTLMLLALLMLGIRVVANAQNGSSKFLPLSATSLSQLVLVGCILIAFLPLHFFASQFYFDAVMLLSPKF